MRLAGITKGRPILSDRAGWVLRVVPVAVAGVVLMLAIAVAAARYSAFETRRLVAIDYQTFVAFGERFLTTGSMYLPYQTTGPFNAQPLPHVPALMPSMYPPTTGYVFALLTILPGVLWWAIPIGVIAYGVLRWRPARWSWPILALMACSPVLWSVFIVGSSTMWLSAGIAGGLLWGWPAVVILGKPMYAPLALLGVRRRSWWFAIAGLALLSLPLLPEWFKYVAVIQNADLSGYGGLDDVPLLAWPAVAWFARTTHPMSSRGT